LQDPTIAERNCLFLLAQGSFVNDQSSVSINKAVTGNLLLNPASGKITQFLYWLGTMIKLQFGIVLLNKVFWNRSTDIQGQKIGG